MKTKIKALSLIFAIVLIGFTSCEDTEYSLGNLTAPTNLVITADIVGQSVDFPNGDGTGMVNFTFSADDALSYKVDFGDGGGDDLYSSTETKQFNGVGTQHYTVIVTALGTGGTATTTTMELDVYYAYEVDPLIVTLLTGDTAEGKKWIIDKDLQDNFGKGPGPDREDGLTETFTPSWWTAGPNGRESKGSYNDVYVFRNTKVFTHESGGELYGTKSFFADEFDPTTPGSYGGFADEWILTYPDYTVDFDFDGDSNGPGGSEVTYITFPQKGHIGYFSGSHRMMILDITETTMWIRATVPGTNISAWYFRLKILED